mmetsp:Transcript_16414/g.29132  ORF Transcript_16414/g.29132 Transcript_16414/m.29132 type:complete len:490 (-) Transcript_16414:352-1821(-)
MCGKGGLGRAGPRGHRCETRGWSGHRAWAGWAVREGRGACVLQPLGGCLGPRLGPDVVLVLQHLAGAAHQPPDTCIHPDRELRPLPPRQQLPHDIAAPDRLLEDGVDLLQLLAPLGAGEDLPHVHPDGGADLVAEHDLADGLLHPLLPRSHLRGPVVHWQLLLLLLQLLGGRRLRCRAGPVLPGADGAEQHAALLRGQLEPLQAVLELGRRPVQPREVDGRELHPPLREAAAEEGVEDLHVLEHVVGLGPDVCELEDGVQEEALVQHRVTLAVPQPVGMENAVDVLRGEVGGEQGVEHAAADVLVGVLRHAPRLWVLRHAHPPLVQRQLHQPPLLQLLPLVELVWGVPLGPALQEVRDGSQHVWGELHRQLARPHQLPHLPLGLQVPLDLHPAAELADGGHCLHEDPGVDGRRLLQKGARSWGLHPFRLRPGHSREDFCLLQAAIHPQACLRALNQALTGHAAHHIEKGLRLLVGGALHAAGLQHLLQP